MRKRKTLAVIMSFVLVFSLVITALVVNAAGEEPLHAYGYEDYESQHLYFADWYVDFRMATESLCCHYDDWDFFDPRMFNYTEAAFTQELPPRCEVTMMYTDVSAYIMMPESYLEKMIGSSITREYPNWYPSISLYIYDGDINNFDRSSIDRDLNDATIHLSRIVINYEGIVDAVFDFLLPSHYAQEGMGISIKRSYPDFIPSFSVVIPSENGVDEEEVMIPLVRVIFPQGSRVYETSGDDPWYPANEFMQDAIMSSNPCNRCIPSGAWTHSRTIRHSPCDSRCPMMTYVREDRCFYGCGFVWRSEHRNYPGDFHNRITGTFNFISHSNLPHPTTCHHVTQTTPRCTRCTWTGGTTQSTRAFWCPSPDVFSDPIYELDE